MTIMSNAKERATSFIFSLTLTDLCLLGVGILSLWYIVSAVIAWYRLRGVPGPFLASFSYLWLAQVAQGAKQYYVHRDLCRRYGALVRVGPNELTTDDPEVIRKMSAVRSSYSRDPWYLGARFDPYHDNIISTMDNAAHDKLKSTIGGAFGGREAPLLEPGIDRQVGTLIETIRKYYLWDPSERQNRLMDFAPLMSYLTMDVITKVAFGEEFGYLKANADLYDFIREVRENWPRLAMAVDIPWIRNVLFSPLLLRYFGPSVEDEVGMGKLMSVAQQTVGKRFRPDAKAQRDMLGSWIRNGLTQTRCEIEGLTMIVAGSDTTASVLRITMLYLMTCPYVYRKLKSEIEIAIREGRASSPVSFEEAKRLPYLQAVVYEGLRMRPPAPGLYPKAVPPEGDVIHGKFIPGGTGIGMNTASLFSSTRHFGADADIFRPERFTEADDASRIEMERLVELGFGYGRFMCAGKPVAFMELNKVFFELLRVFDFQLANPTKPWESRSYSVFVEENMWVKVTEAGTA
ncbi:pisatin demethylase [Xylariales sp. AK1849]|nr:pisatin demethylase [Xylariales sp. AK1849]